MEGDNMIRLNELTMVKVVQHYFETVLFREGVAPVVKSVKPAKDNSRSYSEVDLFDVQVQARPTGGGSEA